MQIIAGPSSGEYTLSFEYQAETTGFAVAVWGGTTAESGTGKFFDTSQQSPPSGSVWSETVQHLASESVASTGNTNWQTASYTFDVSSQPEHLFVAFKSNAFGNTGLGLRNISLRSVGGGTTVIAADDDASVDEGGSKSVAVLDNDTGATQIDSFTQGSVGSVSQSGDELVYTPNLGVWSGTDSFDYTAGNGSTSDSATVTMTIDPTNGTTDPIGGGDFDQLLAFRNADGDIRERSDGSYELAAYGGDGISTDTSGDQFLFAQKEVSGDFTVHARVKSIDGPSGSFAGVMLRDGGDEAAHATLEKMAFEASEKGDFYLSQERTTAGDGAAVAVRSQIGGTDVSHSEPEKWVMIERAGDEITYYTGEDDGSGSIVYTEIDAGPVTLTGLSDTVQVGLFTISGDGSDNATAVFDNYTVSATGGGGGGESHHDEVNDQVVMEAEDGVFDESGGSTVWDTITGETNASEETYVTSTANETGTAPDSNNIGRRNIAYTFDATGGEDYEFFVRLNANGGSNDSFYFRVTYPDDSDSGWIRWWNGLDTGSNWEWKKWSGNAAGTGGEFDGLSSGVHTLEITYREDGTHLDKFVVQKASVADLSGTGFGPDSTLTADEPGGGTPASLLVHYDFDDNGGATATDASGNGRDGSITGATWSGDTPDGSTSSLSFDGSDDLVEDADAADYLDGLDAYTVTVWVKSNSDTNNAGIYRLTTGSGDTKNQLRYDAAGWGGGGTKVLKAGFETTTTSVQAESADNAMSTVWQHIALSWSSGGEPKLYLDGQPFDWDTDGTPYAPGSLDGVLSEVQTLLIGAGGTNETWDGLIDDFRIYGEELSAGEISDIHSGD
ncbi:MAG: LamG-like jellyroll fold domain-containing protein [Verrucomicrobiota bacterium]